ncbi:aminotransferase class I/II-fold pyridoxal phosphate-dependent enzyme [Kiloniella laminariae]|uniref:Aminotransferase class I/II-fold pyridoxal phosphate-dependent enzyme n=1 Tax=Kiloniella laminariae TaxID=454162 RepID=A0ABT4LI41_9PROT|nr:aminotransferase class I/II-fold pyridoxal phosphate-dependent enzyme [Kiloniella laminariae]MCZ4279672.1 aminotransferase class I/II-fold pyridoxal phosphate-dependent enzyme [Kiloniella laminariae]
MRDFTLETFFSKWEFAARYHMTASDMQSMSVSELLALADQDDREAFDKLHLGYTETWGAPDLRAEIAKTYDRAEPDDILCFAGAEEGIYIAMKVLLEPDDHAIVVVPNYQAAETLPLSICAVSGVPLDAGDNWSLDIAAVRAAIRPNTRLISINFPNNPTGAVLERSRFDALVALCREHGIWLFSDEVYRGVEREESLRLPQVGDVYERGLSLNVMSKAYGLPGLRIGWIMTRDREIRSRMERYKHYLSICNSAPSERLSLIALKARDKILARNRVLLAENALKLGNFFAEFPDLFDWRQPEGGCVGYPRYKGPGSTDDFCEKLVSESGVLLLPPHIYHSELLPTPSDRFRVGFGRANIDEGLSAFRAWLRRNG